jgi:hypothetical protein
MSGSFLQIVQPLVRRELMLTTSCGAAHMRSGSGIGKPTGLKLRKGKYLRSSCPETAATYQNFTVTENADR